MKKDWWLHTTNYLENFKGYFATKDEAIEKLQAILKSSTIKHKKLLKKNMLLNNDSLDHDRVCFHIDKYESWHNFKDVELAGSIKLMNLEGIEDKDKKAIFMVS